MSYQSKVVNAPRLAGAGLRAFARLVEQPVGGRIVREQLLRQLGLDTLRASRVDGMPTDPGPLPADPAAHPTDPGADPYGPLRRVLERTAGPQRASFPLYLAYRDGLTDPVAVAERFLAALEVADTDEPPLRGFIAQYPEDLRAQARASAERWARGEPLSLLDGVPVSVKDEVDQVPYPTTAGTRLPVSEATSDSTPVARLRNAGALLVGKANMHELGSGLTGINPHWGTPHNPYDPRRACGGSSSGSAALVAAGLTPISVACDGGGSIRMPAAFCGVPGLKATYGRVSHHGAADLIWTTAHTGPIGATVADVALAYLAMAGPDPKDPRSLVQPKPHLEGFDHDDLRGIRLGVDWEWFNAAEEEIVAKCRAQVDRLRALGAEIVPIDLPDLELLQLAHVVLIGVEMAASQQVAYDADRRVFSHETRVSMALSRGLLATDYVHAQRLRSRFIRQWLTATKGLHAILTPTTGQTAPLIGQDAEQHGESDLAQAGAIMRFMPPGNILGFPGLSVPVGYDVNGLPIGLQVLGRPFLEHVLLRIGRLIEEGVGWRPPQRWYGPSLDSYPAR
ncbi:MAG: amidase [Deltaproteobacteria bacterium]|nr:MAG: amidase [Deltaproteobacteria bacterium]